VEELPLQEFAESLGLAGQPKIKFLKGDDAKQKVKESKVIMLPNDDEAESSKPVGIQSFLLSYFGY
jgi:ATP-dependent RNA helicase DDX10/DBP4